MSLVCEFELRSPDIPMTPIAGELGTTLHVDDVISGTEGPPALVFSATDVEPARLEAAMDDDDHVAEYVALESTYVESRYRVTLDGGHTDLYTHLVDLRTHPMDAMVTGQGWTVRARFADRDDLESFRVACGDAGVGFRPRRLFETEGDPDSDYGLTTPQREALLAAHRMGYFDVPRGADLSDLADELGTTTSALSERLRRGQGRLIEHTIAGTGT